MMKKLGLLTAGVVIILLFFGSNACASVTEGRKALFNNGEPRYDYLLIAHNHFTNALESKPNDPEANLFYSLTRLAPFSLQPGSGGTKTLRDVLEAFGMARNNNVFLYEGPPYDSPEVPEPEYYPELEKLQDFLFGSYMDLLNDILKSLDKIPSSYSTILTSQETGDQAVKLDYGEVLIYKSLINANKFLIYATSSYNLDLKLADIFTELENEDGELPRRYVNDLLKSNPDFLKLFSEEQQRLESAKHALLNAINLYLQASQFIRTRSPSSTYNLIFFDQEDLEEEELFRDNLDKLKASINKPSQVAYLGDPADELVALNLSPFFGDYDGPFNLRDFLPRFDQCNYPISGTMGHGLGDDPTLGGILPELTQAYWDFDTPFCAMGMPWLFLLLDDE